MSSTQNIEDMIVDRGRGGVPNPPLVSVIICVYNAGEYFRPSLMSILNQTYSNLEILIVDDGSTDGCIETVEDLLADSRVRLFRQANGTKPVALNRALDQAHGEFYAVHDADDFSHPRRIERQVQALLDQPHLAAAFCRHHLIINGKPMAPTFAPRSKSECLRAIEAFKLPAHDPTAMYRMSLVRNDQYDPSLPVVEGLDYILRVGEERPMMVIGECLYGYRILMSSVTRRDPTATQDLVAKALAKACQRRGLDYAQVFPNGPFDPRQSKRRLLDNNTASFFIDSVLEQKQARRQWAP